MSQHPWQWRVAYSDDGAFTYCYRLVSKNKSWRTYETSSGKTFRNNGPLDGYPSERDAVIEAVAHLGGLQIFRPNDSEYAKQVRDNAISLLNLWTEINANGNA